MYVNAFFFFVWIVLTLAVRKTKEGSEEKLCFQWNSFFKEHKVLQEQLHLSEKKACAAVSRRAVTVE